jgi:hypothetical protein
MFLKNTFNNYRKRNITYSITTLNNSHFLLTNYQYNNFLLNPLSKSFAKKSTNRPNTSSSKKDDNEEFEEQPVHDRDFEGFLKKQEQSKKEKEKEREKQIVKREEGIQCLVLHPVFLQK